ncbi:copper homeostasis CutC domain-containing protein [Rhodocollybia butyracea]|uniref:Copper homeostasis protein cutC homolog n=1 Tax=Rhodocollybia butyracea TaxID=206335 RepID=A0A9P5Q5B5_9AGAR|nr:copper homeostasis CutC domain-containing protein [Rhodocollybia butyracea]
MQIEVCIDSVDSAINAARGGADRLELCGNLGLGGGSTPSLGLLKAVQKAVTLPIMVMIRPRTGDFLYSDSEMETMLEDIKIFKDHGVQGFVFGVLTPEGRVDVVRTKREVILLTSKSSVCFHRAFDMTRDVKEAIGDVLKIDRVTRILTRGLILTCSGQGKSVSESLDVLAWLQETSRAAGVTVMPGSGINPHTVGPILDRLLPLGLSEIHLSAGSWVEGAMSFRRDGMDMGVGNGEWDIWRTNEETVQNVRQQVESLENQVYK